jgi:hypothetical protein
MRRGSIPLKVIEDIDSQKVWVTPVMTGSDWPVYFLVRLEYTEEWGDDAVKQYGKYHLSICAVAPTAPEQSELNRAMSSWGLSPEDWGELDDARKCMVLLGYGTYATLWQQSGNNQSKLLKAAREELPKMHMLFGFYMDRACNAIGNSGWDFIRGDIGFKSAAAN